MSYPPYQISASSFREHAGRIPAPEDIPEDYHVQCEDACSRIRSATVLVILAVGVVLGYGLSCFSRAFM